MRTFISIALAGIVSAATEAESAFISYISEFGKSYHSVEEYNFRFS